MSEMPMVEFDLDLSDDKTRLADDIVRLAKDHDLPDGNVVEALVGMIGHLGGIPNTVFEEPPEYARDILGPSELTHPVAQPAPPATSTHGFFDVVSARASRRDFGTENLDLERLMALLHWTAGKRGECIAYDYRSAPLRYIPSAGGLASIDAYVVAASVEGLEPGAYYYDYRSGLRLTAKGYMAWKVAELNPGQEWLGRAAAFIVFVANTDRVVHKYGPMAFKLLMMDAGIAVGHAELVATALELRTCIIGGLSQRKMSRLLRLDGAQRVPIVTLAVGTRSGV